MALLRRRGVRIFLTHIVPIPNEPVRFSWTAIKGRLDYNFQRHWNKSCQLPTSPVNSFQASPTLRYSIKFLQSFLHLGCSSFPFPMPKIPLSTCTSSAKYCTKWSPAPFVFMFRILLNFLNKLSVYSFLFVNSIRYRRGQGPLAYGQADTSYIVSNNVHTAYEGFKLK